MWVCEWVIRDELFPTLSLVRSVRRTYRAKIMDIYVFLIKTEYTLVIASVVAPLLLMLLLVSVVGRETVGSSLKADNCCFYWCLTEFYSREQVSLDTNQVAKRASGL